MINHFSAFGRFHSVSVAHFAFNDGNYWSLGVTLNIRNIVSFKNTAWLWKYEKCLVVRTEEHTCRQGGQVCTVRFCFVGPPFRNSWLGKMTQNPITGPELIHPWTPPSLLSIEYWYIQSLTAFCQHEINIISCSWRNKQSSVPYPTYLSFEIRINWIYQKNWLRHN